MPVPGPRNQHGQYNGYRNPNGDSPTRFNDWDKPNPIWWPGQSPGMSSTSLRGNVLGYGIIRKLWRQSIDFVAAQPPYSTTANGNSFAPPRGVGITRALRYMTRCIYVGAGTDNGRFDAMHTIIDHQTNQKTVTIGAGNSRGRPTVRNRMSSFGSRVPTLNQTVQAAESQQ